MKTIIDFKVYTDYNISLKFSDGIEGTVNLSYLSGKGVFSFWKNYHEFEKVSIGSSGELTWEDKADLCPDALYMKITGKNPEDLFPVINQEYEHA
jgi:hypothetical protein